MSPSKIFQARPSYYACYLDLVRTSERRELRDSFCQEVSCRDRGPLTVHIEDMAVKWACAIPQYLIAVQLHCEP